MHPIWIALLLISLNIRVDSVDVYPSKSVIKGLSLVAPPRPFVEDPMIEIKGINAEWIAVIPYAYSKKGMADVRFNTSGYQWWGEVPKGIIRTIELANSNGLSVLLKPQVYVPRSWPGEIDFESEAEWSKWEDAYRKYVMTYAHIAADYEVDMFCVGTEFKLAAVKRSAFWEELIQEIRRVYDGPLTYAANWDNYQRIGFWQDLDYIGIDAYFPLSEQITPSVETLMKAWAPIENDISSFSTKMDRPVIFTEYGYMSVDQCAHEPWATDRYKNRDINEDAQANALTALHLTFMNKSYWSGSFLWKWFPNMKGGEGFTERDYTPQGKKAAQILKEVFSN